MNNIQQNLEILYMSNYEYILYSSSNGKLFLTLTRESGFGVYDYTIETNLANIEDKDLVEKEIADIRSDYLRNPDEFSKKYAEVILGSDKTKGALDKWISNK